MELKKLGEGVRSAGFGADVTACNAVKLLVGEAVILRLDTISGEGISVAGFRVGIKDASWYTVSLLLG